MCKEVGVGQLLSQKLVVEQASSLICASIVGSQVGLGYSKTFSCAS